MAIIPQSTVYIRTFPLYLNGQGTARVAATGKTVTVNLSKNGGAFGAAAGAVAEISAGWYKVSLTIVDTNTLGDLSYNCTAAGSDQTDFTDQVGPIISNLVQIDSLATASNSATLNLKKLNIVNNAGDAVVASSTGSNGSGINASGNGSGLGIIGTGGTTGSGLVGIGGNTSGSGIVGQATTSGVGLQVLGAGSNQPGLNAAGGTNANGIQTTGAGTGSGFTAIAGLTGNGIVGLGGATSGAGMIVTAVGSGLGLSAIGVGTSSIGAGQGISGPLDTSERNAIADALLKRDMSSVTGEASRSPLNCFRLLRNKVSNNGTTQTITKEDNTTPAWTSTITTNATAPPITSYTGN